MQKAKVKATPFSSTLTVSALRWRLSVYIFIYLSIYTDREWILSDREVRSGNRGAQLQVHQTATVTVTTAHSRHDSSHSLVSCRMKHVYREDTQIDAHKKRSRFPPYRPWNRRKDDISAGSPPSNSELCKFLFFSTFLQGHVDKNV